MHNIVPTSLMQATRFEFRARWWVSFLIIVVAFLAYFIDHTGFSEAFVLGLAARVGTSPTDNWYRLFFCVGTLLLAACAGLHTWASSYMKLDVMVDSRIHTNRLLADGPYRYVRNPLYLGNIFLALGLGLVASRLGFLILSLGMTVFHIRLILREEAELVRDQGEPYQRYCAAVPRLFPSLTPRIPSGSNVPHWGQAFRVQVVYWSLALAMGVFTVTLNIKIFWTLFAVAMGTLFLHKAPNVERPQ